MTNTRVQRVNTHVTYIVPQNEWFYTKDILDRLDKISPDDDGVSVFRIGHCSLKGHGSTSSTLNKYRTHKDYRFSLWEEAILWGHETKENAFAMEKELHRIFQYFNLYKERADEGHSSLFWFPECALEWLGLESKRHISKLMGMIKETKFKNLLVAAPTYHFRSARSIRSIAKKRKINPYKLACRGPISA